MCVSVNEGMKAVCFGWGTAWGGGLGGGAEGAETVRESADREGRAAGRNRRVESTVSLCVKSIQIHPPTAIASVGQLRIITGR